MYQQAVDEEQLSVHAPTYVPVYMYLKAVGEEQLLCACSYFSASELSSPVPGSCGWGAAPLRMFLLVYL
jgi:hypothetical protein